MLFKIVQCWLVGNPVVMMLASVANRYRFPIDEDKVSCWLIIFHVHQMKEHKWCVTRVVLRSDLLRARRRRLWLRKVFFLHNGFRDVIFLFYFISVFSSKNGKKDWTVELRGKVTLGWSSISYFECVFLYVFFSLAIVIFHLVLHHGRSRAQNVWCTLSLFLFIWVSILCTVYFYRLCCDSLQQQREQQSATMATVVQTVTNGTNWATSNERQQIERRLALIHRDIELKRAAIKNLRLSLQQTNVSE